MLRIGVLCPSEIAFRRFLPAVLKSSAFKYVGVAVASKEEWFGTNDNEQVKFDNVHANEIIKAQKFKDVYGGSIYEGYEDMLSSGNIDAVYLPLPPSLHFSWAKKAISNNLHVMVEKPSTISLEDTTTLVKLCKEKDLAIHENYMFLFHNQIAQLDNVIRSGEIGSTYLYRIEFGFPNRGKSDFRYNKDLGGGALFDCGGYTLKYANYLLGGNAKVTSATMSSQSGYDVDLFGTATLVSLNKVAQVAFGMDNDYRCNIDVWGSKGTLISKRVLTAPEGFVPTYEIIKDGESRSYQLSADDPFLKSIEFFYKCTQDSNLRHKAYEDIIYQEKLVSDFLEMTRGE